MSENIKVENWCGYDIRFVEHEGNWYAVLKDICDALKLQTRDVKDRIECEHLIKTAVIGNWNRPVGYDVAKNLTCGSQPPIKIETQNVQRTFAMLCVDEAGIYQALSRSTRLEARKFIDWMSHSMVQLRKAVGLESFEALKLTDSSIQKAISDTIGVAFKEPTGDIIPIESAPTVVNNITNINVDYKKVIGYGAIGGILVLVGVGATRYIIRRVRAKKETEKTETIHEIVGVTQQEG